jgi:hypothetical protein
LAELERLGLLPSDGLAVFCVGSVAQGWDNQHSDVDLIVITADAWTGERTRTISVPLTPRTVPMVVSELGARRWEVKYWMDAQVDQMLAKVSHDQFESGPTRSRALLDAEELFLERLPTCLPLQGEEWVRQRRADLDRSAFRAFVVSRSLAAADGSIEDALGQLSGLDLCSAVLSARNAFGHTVDALLESRGVYGSQETKWRARRFLRANPPPLSFDTYWALETMAGLDPDRPEKWVEHVVSFCKDLVLDVEM